jgi:hypothetical protein
MFHTNISNNTTHYESPGERESHMQVCESCSYGGTGNRYPPSAGDTWEDNPGPLAGKTGSDKARITSAVAGCVIYMVINAIMLFGSAGTLDWPMAWAFIVISLAVFIAGILRSSPDLLDERSRRHDDSKIWDRVIVSVLATISFIILIVAGLTVRFGMGGQVPLNVQVLALVILTLGNCLIVWATWTNRFFSATVRLQTDRGHEIVSDGLYRYVRHPGHAGISKIQNNDVKILNRLY